MIIDAKDTLNGDECPDGFVIVSTDSDFTKLVQRLRTLADNDGFVDLGCAGTQLKLLTPGVIGGKLSDHFSGRPDRFQKQTIGSATVVALATKPWQLELMTKAMHNCVADNEGFVDMGCVGTQLNLLTPGGIDGNLSDHFIGRPDRYQIKTIGSATFVALVTKPRQLEPMTKAMQNCVANNDGFVDIGSVDTQLKLLIPGGIVGKLSTHFADHPDRFEIKTIGSATFVAFVTKSRQLELMTKAMQNCVADNDGFVDLGSVDTQLNLLTPCVIGGKLSDHFIGHPNRFQIKTIGSATFVAHATKPWQLELMTKAMQKCVAHKDGFIKLSCVGDQLKKMTPGGIGGKLSDYFVDRPNRFIIKKIGRTTVVALV